MQSILSSKDARTAVAFEKGYRTHEPMGKIGNLSYGVCAGCRKARVPNIFQRVHVRWLVFKRRLIGSSAVAPASAARKVGHIFQKGMEDLLGKLQVNFVNMRSEAVRRRVRSSIVEICKKLELLQNDCESGSITLNAVAAVSGNTLNAQVVKDGLTYLLSNEKAWFREQDESCKMRLLYIAESVGVQDSLYRAQVSDPPGLDSGT